MNRRDFLIKTALATSIPVAMSASGQAFSLPASASSVAPVQRQSGHLSWLDGKEPDANTGATWGHPWPKGQLKTGQSLRLLNGNGERVPLQT